MKKINGLFLLLIYCIICNFTEAQNLSRDRGIAVPGTQIRNHSEKIAGTLVTTALSGYYFEGFETSFPPPGWQVVDAVNNTTTWTESSFADIPAAYEGTSSAYCQYTQMGGVGEDWLITPKFTVSAGDSFSFQFKLEYFGYPPDSTFILISTTDSALSSFTDTLDFYIEGLNYPLDSSYWHYKTYPLFNYAGQNIYVAFKNVNNFGDGIFIDNVEIGTRPASDAGVLSIDLEKLNPVGVTSPVATIKNHGGVTQTFSVTMNITGGYSSTKSVTLSPLGVAPIIFDPWNATVGPKSITVQTLLPGDVNNLNDTASLNIQVLETFLNYGWSQRDILAEPTYGGAAVSVNNPGDIRYYLLGGVDGSSITANAFEYRMNFGSWASIDPMPVSACYSASASANGKLFVLARASVSTGTPEPTTKIYDITSEMWSTGAPCPVPVANFAFGTYKDSLVYIIGGNTGGNVSTNLVQIYDLYNDSWSNATTKPGIAVFASRAGISGNKIVLTGGVNPVTGQAIPTTYLGEIDTLNPTGITWTQVDDHPAGIMSRMGTGVSLDKNSGLIVFAGGSNTNSYTTTTAKTLAYDLNSNSWKLGPDKPTSMDLFYMTPVYDNDSVYLAAIGGFDGVGPSNKNEWLNMGYYQLPTGHNEVNPATRFRIYPNPVGDIMNIQMDLNEYSAVTIRILDLAGKVVSYTHTANATAGNTNLKIDTKNLAKGMYLYNVDINGKSVSGKLIKN